MRFKAPWSRPTTGSLHPILAAGQEHAVTACQRACVPHGASSAAVAGRCGCARHVPQLGTGCQSHYTYEVVGAQTRIQVLVHPAKHASTRPITPAALAVPQPLRTIKRPCQDHKNPAQHKTPSSIQPKYLRIVPKPPGRGGPDETGGWGRHACRPPHAAPQQQGYGPIKPVSGRSATINEMQNKP